MDTLTTIVPAAIGGEESIPEDLAPSFLCKERENNGSSKNNKSKIITHNHLDFYSAF